MANENCLEGMRCPECGSEEPFRIVVTTMVVMYDQGSDNDGMSGDVAWDETSYCQCWECDHDGIVKDFHINPEEDTP